MAIPSIATPASFRTASCGASAAQGTHQLANILSRRGLPFWNSAVPRQGRSATAAGIVDCGNAFPIMRVSIVVSAGLIMPNANTLINNSDERRVVKDGFSTGYWRGQQSH